MSRVLPAFLGALAAALLVLSGIVASDPATVQALSASGCKYTPMSLSWLSQQAAAWSGAPPGPVLSAAVLSAASYGAPEEPWDTLPVIEADLAMLKASGAEVVRIDLNYAPWLDNDTAHIQEMDEVVAQVRADGLELMIADSASESYWHHPMPWPAFVSAWIARDTALALRYHPDDFVVVKEPGWYFPMISGYPANPAIGSVSAWIALTQSLVGAVRSVSPHTQIGVAIPAATLYGSPASSSRSYLTAARDLPGLDFLGFDVYGICEMENTLRFLAEEGTGGKAVWVPEAWSTGTPEGNPGGLDVAWMGVLYEFLREIGARGVALFYTDAFASFAAAPQNSSALLAFYALRTADFFAFENLTTSERSYGFTVPLLSATSGCPDPTVRGGVLGTGPGTLLPGGTFSLQAPRCVGASFEAWTWSGAVELPDPLSANSTLEVEGPGQVGAVYVRGPTPGAVVALVVEPASCPLARVLLDGVSGAGGSSWTVTPGQHTLSESGCPGMSLGPWSTQGNVSVLPNGTLLVTGPGVLEAVYVPPAPGPQWLSLPEVDGLTLVLWPVAAVVLLALIALLDRRGRRTAKGGAREVLAPARGSISRSSRWAVLAWVTQATAGLVYLLAAVLFTSWGYSVGGEGGFALLLASEVMVLLVVLTLAFAWSSSVRPLRRGDREAGLRGTRWMIGVGALAGFGVAGLLYMLAYRSALRQLPRSGGV